MRDCGEMGMGMSESWEIAGVRRTNPLSRKWPAGLHPDNGTAFTARLACSQSSLLLRFAEFFAAAIGDRRSATLSETPSPCRM